MSLQNGMAAVFATVATSTILCLGMWFRSRIKFRTGPQDEYFNRLVLCGNSFRDQDIPIDEVVGNLAGEDLSGFHL